MSYTRVDEDKVAAVFEIFQIHTSDGIRYIPQFFIAQAVRELGYCPTVQLLHDTLKRVVPAGEHVTYPCFVKLCEAMKGTQNLSAASIKHMVQAFDVHGNGTVRRSEFRTIFTTASSDLSAGEIEAILELLDPLHTNIVQLRALQTVMERYVSGDTGFISSPSCARRSQRRNDRHLQPFPLNIDADKRKSRRSAGDGAPRERRERPAPKVASAPEEEEVSGNEQPSMESDRSPAANPPLPRHSRGNGGGGRQRDARASPVLNHLSPEPVQQEVIVPDLRLERLNSASDQRYVSRNSPTVQISSNGMRRVSEINGAALPMLPLDELGDATDNSTEEVVDIRGESIEAALPTRFKKKVLMKKKKIMEKCCKMA